MNKASLLLRKETYRLWFEFYKLALQSREYEVINALKASQEFYAPWGNVLNSKFDDWWESHQNLFKEHQVKTLESLEDRQSSESLILEIPLNQAISKLLGEIKKIIEDRQKTKPNYRKRKTTFTSSYQLTAGSEPKLDTVRNILIVYRDVYLANNKPSAMKTLELAVEFYKRRKRNNKIPYSLMFGDRHGQLDNARRNVGRWLNWAKKIVLNTAKGEFPGKY